MFHLVAFSESLDQGGAEGNIAAVPDDTLYTSGDIIRVPNGMANLAGVAFIGTVTAYTTGELKAPSLRTRTNYFVSAVNNAGSPINPLQINNLADNPIPLEGEESLTCVTNTDAAAATDLTMLVVLSDGPIQPVAGSQFTVAATAAITQADQAWNSGILTFNQDLPTGDYDVVGLRVQSGTGQAARLIFPGGNWRPGVPIVDSIGDVGWAAARHGGLGVMGSFNSNNPPQLDMLGGNSTSQVVYLDLIRRS